MNKFFIKTPADYHSFCQAPIMGSLIFVGFASWLIMSIASVLTYIVIGGGLGNVYTEAGCTLTQGLIFTSTTGLIMISIVYLLTKLIKKNEIPKWAYNLLLVTSLFLIIGLPYVYAHNQISQLVYHNLLNLGTTSYVDGAYVIANPLKFLGVLLNFYQWGNSSGILKFLIYLNVASVAAAGATIGLRLGNFWFTFMLKLINNKKMVSYINLLISLVILTLIHKQGYLLPFIRGDECGWWERFMGDEKTHFLSYHIKTLCIRMGATLFLCFGLKHLLLRLINITIIIINFVFKKQITINSIIIRICTIVAVTVFGVMILNDAILFLSFKNFIATTLSNYSSPNGVNGLGLDGLDTGGTRGTGTGTGTGSTVAWIKGFDITQYIEELLEAVVGFITGMVLLIQKVIRDLLNLISKPGSDSQDMVMGMNCNDAPLDTKPQDLEKTNNIMTMDGKGSGDTPEGALTSPIPDSRPVTPDTKTDAFVTSADPAANSAGFVNWDEAKKLADETYDRAIQSVEFANKVEQVIQNTTSVPCPPLAVPFMVAHEAGYHVTSGLMTMGEGITAQSVVCPTSFGGDGVTPARHEAFDKRSEYLFTVNKTETTTTILNSSNSPSETETAEVSTNSKPESTSDSKKNKPIQNGSYFLLPIAFFPKNPEYGALLSFDPFIPTADPFFHNMCIVFRSVFELAFLLGAFLISFSLIGILLVIYNSKFPNLKSFLSKKKNIMWKISLRVLLFYIYSTITKAYYLRFLLVNTHLIAFLDTNYLSYFYYKPPGLDMGSSRVLHPADYSPIFTYFNFEYINPDYILHVVTFIRYCAISIFILAIYFIIATVTTMAYNNNNNNTLLSLPGGPASLNLFTKCFYFKSQQARIKYLLGSFGIMLIFMTLAAIILYHYINIYHLG